MLNFTFYNPVRIVFGRGSIARLKDLVPQNARAMLTYGGGSIKRNGVHEQVTAALGDRLVAEFSGIEPNPEYSTLMKAVEKARVEKVDFLVAAGGGSVVDGTKFISAAVHFGSDDPWEMVDKAKAVEKAVPLGAVVTLPATASEMNTIAVISNRKTGQKKALKSEKIYPRFSILDPEATFTLPERQTINGIVDTMAHVMEQYITYPTGAMLADEYAEGILRTVIANAHKVIENPRDYDARANLMWCATQGLNHLLTCGTVGDFASHRIGHEITALYGVDHARTLAIVMPALYKCRMKAKSEKLARFAEKVWGITDGGTMDKAAAAVEKLEEFIHSFGVGTRLSDYGIGEESVGKVAKKAIGEWEVLGEKRDIREPEVVEILKRAL